MDSFGEIEGFEDGANARQIFGFGRDKRQTPDGLEQGHFGERGFHGDGIGLDEVNVHQRKILKVESAGFHEIASERGWHEPSHFRRNFMGGDGNQAAAAECDQRKSQGVVARENEKVPGDEVQDCAHLSDAARGFLDADDVGDLRKAQDGGRFDVDAGAALNAIENDGQVDGGRDGFEVLEEAFLGGLVVVRSDGKNSIRAELLEFVGEGDDLGGVVSASAGENRHFALGYFESELDNTEMLGVGERGAFAGGPAGDEEVDARVNLALDESADGGFVEGAVGAEWGYERSAGAGKHGLLLF